MDRGVTMIESVTLDSFLPAVRRRLWLIRLAEAGRALLWYTGFILLALAGVHLLITAIAVTSILAVVGVVSLFFLIRVARQRPTIAQCAAHADRAFSGHALMTTAVECQHLSTDDRGFAAETVLRQADDAAKSWSPEISQRFRQSPAAATVLATIPLFVALVLLSSPGAEKKVDADREATGTVPSVAAVKNTGADDGTDDVAALRRIIVDESSANTLTSDEQRSSDTLIPSQNDDTTAELATPPEQAGSLAGVAGLAGDDGDLPGDAIARSTPPDDSLAENAFFQRRESVELQRSGSGLSAGRKVGPDYSESARWTLASPNLIRAAAAPETLTHSTVLSRAQAAHARLYLEESGKGND